MKTIYRLDLTPHERAAFLTVLADYITMPGAIEVSVDASAGTEIPIGLLLARVINLQPMPETDQLAMDVIGDLQAKLQLLVNWVDKQLLLEDHVFTFPDGDTWEAKP